jgi:hypothetical protein
MHAFKVRFKKKQFLHKKNGTFVGRWYIVFPGREIGVCKTWGGVGKAN